MMWKTEEVTDLYLTALCAWREARGCSDDGIRGVLHVIKNRGRKPSWWGGPSLASVVLKPMQFSSFNTGDPNATKFPHDGDQIFRKILELASNVLVGQDEDLTGGATHYHDSSVFPPWALHATKLAQIGTFTFYKET